MTIGERLAAIRDASDGEDLARLLGVDPAAIAFGSDGVTIGGETISYADARAALSRDRAAGRSVNIEDL